MKNNRQYVLVYLLLLMTTANVAQAQTEVSLKIGTHYSKVMLENTTGKRQKTQFTPGWHIGLSVDVPVGNEFYIQPSLLYTRKGFTQEDSWFAGTDNSFDVKANYFELFVNFLYKSPLGSGKLLFGAGPYLGYGTGGKWESEKDVVIGDIIYGDHGDVHFSNDAMDGGGGNSYLYGKPLDYGVNFLVGYEFFNKIIAQLNVQLGLANLIPEFPDGTKRDGTFKNIGFGVTLGYKL